MKSMTGYAYEEVLSSGTTVSVEIKSYNSRFLDLTVNLPSFLSRLEMRFREEISSAIQRGKVDVFIKIKESNTQMTISADTEAAKAYANEIKKIADCLNYDGAIPLSLIINQEGVLNSQREIDVEYYWNLIDPIFKKAVSSFVADREREGKNLSIDICEKVKKLDEAAALFTEWQPKMEVLFKENIQKRFVEVLGDQVEEQRVLQETASLLVKYTINEEIVRLKSHLAAVKKEIAENEAPGRKLDFICQEINREINTIGSKNQFTEVGTAVISAKDALENIREQIRNIE